MGYPPRNLAMPSELAPLKNTLKSKPKPMKVPFSNPDMDLFFKQDDTFDQPKVEIRCKIMCSDCDFPSTTESLLFSMMWTTMFA